MADEKKLIIDEDWKSQVQAEKEEAAKNRRVETPAGSAPDRADAGDMPMPPATFEMLITTLATEALMALGQVPHPVTNEVRVATNQAKYLIDTIDMLREKTTGNLNAREQELLESVLHQLRMAFVEITNQPENVGGVSPQA